jgi:hypothetical protein
MAVGAPSCPLTSVGACPTAWAAPELASAGVNEKQSLIFGFADLVAVDAVVVVENHAVGFLTGIDVLDFAVDKWVAVASVADGTRTPGTTPRIARFAVPGGVVSQFVRLNVSSTGTDTQIDGVMLIGRSNPPVGCLPVVELTPLSPQVDNTIGDEFCINRACQWACRLNDCSSWRFNSSSDKFGCRNVLGFAPESTFWSPAVALMQTDFIDVSFKLPVVPSHVIVIDNDEGNGVTGVDVWVNGSFVSVFEGNVSGSGFVGAEVYALTKPIDLPVNRVRVRFLGYRLHKIEAIRLVGRLDSNVPRVVPTGPRLPGVFKKTVIPLASTTIGRFDTLAQNNPAAVAGDFVYVPPGLAFDPSRSQLSTVTYSRLTDRCDMRNKVCTNFTASFPFAEKFSLPVAAALEFAGTRIFVFGLGREDVSFQKGVGDLFFRTEAAPRWERLSLKQPRREACLVAVQATNEMYIGGGLTIQGNSFSYYGSIERISFQAEDLSVRVETIAFPLMPARAEPGCAVVGVQKKHIMFAGGRFYSDPMQVPSDAVDILDVSTMTIKRSLMSRRAVAVTIASLGSIIILSGGAPTYGPPTFGVVENQFNYASYHNLGVERYDMDSEAWQFVPMVLTQLIYDNVEPDRLPVAFGGRFVAVVSGQTSFSHDGSLDPLRTGEASHERPIDVFDTFTNMWYLSVMQQHAGRSFMVASVNNTLAVFGGRDTPDTVFYSHNKVSFFEWVPNVDPLIQCNASTTCSQCLYTNTRVHVESCVWCFDPTTLAGTCQSDRKSCSVAPQTASAFPPHAICPTAAPTPAPAVRYVRFWRLRIDTEFATWVFADYRPRLVSYLQCDASALSVATPVEQGSVIAVIKHEEEATTKTQVYDDRWSKIAEQQSLRILNATRLADDFIVPSTATSTEPASTSTTGESAATTASSTTAMPVTDDGEASALSPAAVGLYAAIGVLAGLLLLVAIGFCVMAWMGRKSAEAQAKKRDEGLVPLNATPQLESARSHRPSAAGSLTSQNSSSLGGVQ